MVSLQESVRGQCPDVDAALVARHFDSLPASYFERHSAADVARHLRLLAHLSAAVPGPLTSCPSVWQMRSTASSSLNPRCSDRDSCQMNAEEQREKRRLEKICGQNPKNGSKPTTQPSRKSNVGEKCARSRCEAAMMITE